jgi:broad specificity phosphatase PhoE
LVKWTNSIDIRKPVALVVRHSHRATLADYTQMLSGGLTELGKKTSFEIGRRLRVERPAYIFTSFVPRCSETADFIAKGFNDAGGRVFGIDSLDTLFSPEYSEEKIWENLQPDGRNVTEFVNKWASGLFGKGIESFDSFQSRLRSDIVSRLAVATDPVMHIHVTHDLSLMSLKRSLLGRPLVVADREPYLGGIAIVRVDSRLSLFAGNTRKPLETRL